MTTSAIKAAQHKLIKFCKHPGTNPMLKLTKLLKDAFANQYSNNIEKNRGIGMKSEIRYCD